VVGQVLIRIFVKIGLVVLDIISLHVETVHDTYELLCLCFLHHKRSYFIAGAIYQPAGQSLDQFIAQMFQLLNAFHIGNKEVYLIGMSVFNRVRV